MTLTASDLGVLGDLATALGIVKNGGPDPDWFKDPAARLGTMLSNDDQRQALVSFLDAVLDDGASEIDDQGRVRLPIVAHNDPDLTVAVVLEPKEATVVVSLGIELRTTATGGAQARPATESRLDIALFQAARGTASTPDPVLLLGARGGRIRLSSTLHLDQAPPAPDEFHLGSIAVSVDVPTASDDDDPAIGLKLGALQFPGGTPRDLDLSLSHLDELDDIALDLVLGLVRAQAASATGSFQALASLLGLRPGTTIPPLPVEQLATTGVRAIATWLNGVLADATSRAAWFSGLAGLIPGSTVASTGDAVTVTVGDARFLIGVRTQPGPSGRLKVIPTVEAHLGSGPNQVEAIADVLQTDLGDGATRALPRLSLWAHLGRPAGGSEPVVLDLPAAGPTPRGQGRGGAGGRPARRGAAASLCARGRPCADRQPRVPHAGPHLDGRADGRRRCGGR
jgi:large repetitive protein